MGAFWVFFAKKNRLRAGLAGRPRAKTRKRFFLKKEAKTSDPDCNERDCPGTRR
jgi:hypothetical protein